jgi:hypothetical protein
MKLNNHLYFPSYERVDLYLHTLMCVPDALVGETFWPSGFEVATSVVYFSPSDSGAERVQGTASLGSDGSVVPTTHLSVRSAEQGAVISTKLKHRAKHHTLFGKVIRLQARPTFNNVSIICSRMHQTLSFSFGMGTGSSFRWSRAAEA